MMSKVGENIYLELFWVFLLLKINFILFIYVCFLMCFFNIDIYSFYFGVEYFVFVLDNVLIGEFIFVVCYVYGIKSY